MTMSLREFIGSTCIPYLKVAERWICAFGRENVMIPDVKKSASLPLPDLHVSRSPSGVSQTNGDMIFMGNMVVLSKIYRTFLYSH